MAMMRVKAIDILDALALFSAALEAGTPWWADSSEDSVSVAFDAGGAVRLKGRRIHMACEIPMHHPGTVATGEISCEISWRTARMLEEALMNLRECEEVEIDRSPLGRVCVRADRFQFEAKHVENYDTPPLLAPPGRPGMTLVVEASTLKMLGVFQGLDVILTGTRAITCRTVHREAVACVELHGLETTFQGKVGIKGDLLALLASPAARRFLPDGARVVLASDPDGRWLALESPTLRLVTQAASTVYSSAAPVTTQEGAAAEYLLALQDLRYAAAAARYEKMIRAPLALRLSQEHGELHADGLFASFPVRCLRGGVETVQVGIAGDALAAACRFLELQGESHATLRVFPGGRVEMGGATVTSFFNLRRPW